MGKNGRFSTRDEESGGDLRLSIAYFMRANSERMCVRMLTRVG
jgi:hypothetical protein